MWNKKLKLLLILGLFLPNYIQAEEESIIAKVLHIFGITATPSGQKGIEGISLGEIWIMDRNGLNRRKVSDGKNYSSPVFYGANNTILALNSGSLVKIEQVYGLEKDTKLFSLPLVTKLIDSPNYDNKLFILDKNSSLGYVSLDSGDVTYLEYNNTVEKNKAMINYLEGWRRDYSGTSIFVETNTKRVMAGEVEWSDIYLSNEKNETKNISQCSPLNCSQPSLSKSKNFIVYIQEAEE